MFHARHGRHSYSWGPQGLPRLYIICIQQQLHLLLNHQLFRQLKVDMLAEFKVLENYPFVPDLLSAVECR